MGPQADRCYYYKWISGSLGWKGKHLSICQGWELSCICSLLCNLHSLVLDISLDSLNKQWGRWCRGCSSCGVDDETGGSQRLKEQLVSWDPLGPDPELLTYTVFLALSFLLWRLFYFFWHFYFLITHMFISHLFSPPSPIQPDFQPCLCYPSSCESGSAQGYRSP